MSARARTTELEESRHLVRAGFELARTLGITTLLFHVPVTLGTAHQGSAVLLLTAALYLAHVLGRQGSASG